MARSGTIDLRNYDFERKNASLNGDWLFYWKRFADPATIQQKDADGLISVPGDWSLFNKDGEFFQKAYGYGSYLLKVSLPSQPRNYALKVPNIQTAYRLFINGKEMMTRGSPGTSAASSLPNAQTAVVNFTASDSIWLLLQVSNYHFSNSSGIWSAIRLGRAEAILQEKTSAYFISSFLAGGLFIMGFYHVALFLMRRRERSPGYFSIICFSLAVRELFSSEVIFFDFFPDISWQAGVRLLIICFPIAFYFFAKFLWNLFPSDKRTGIKRFFLLFNLAFALCVLFLPAGIYLQAMLVYNLVAFVFSIYVLIKLLIAARYKNDSALLLLFGYIGLIIAIINDTLIQANVIHGIFIVPMAFFIFILFQAIVLAIRFTKAFKNVESLSSELIQTNKSYARFVPMEFSTFLNKPNINSVNLGDGIESEMTVFFADLVDFTAKAQHLSPGEAFSFLNKILAITGPVIRKHNGFIDKYIGDGILAVFPTSAEDAVKAAVEIQGSLKDVAWPHKKSSGQPVQYGIGIHTGKLILGIIGEPERIESTVISDTVNIASRVEHLTRVYKANIIITGQVLKKLDNPEQFSICYLDEAAIRGHDEKIHIHEVIVEKEVQLL